MNKLALVAAAALSVATLGAAAIAQDTTDFDSVDANNDSLVSFEEALGVYSTLTQAIFDQADANGDGSLDEGEFTGLQGLTAGVDAGGDTPSAADTSSSSAM